MQRRKIGDTDRQYCCERAAQVRNISKIYEDTSRKMAAHTQIMLEGQRSERCTPHVMSRGRS